MRLFTMRLSASNLKELEQSIDRRYSPETSIVLRYMNSFHFNLPEDDAASFKECLHHTSIREGARIFHLMRYRQVDIYLLDETSLMFTRTLKSVDGCITTAHCKFNGFSSVAFETGGNTGIAFTVYGQRAGLETYMFLPEQNIPLLKSTIFEPDSAHLIAVADPKLTKKAVQEFVKLKGIAHIPQIRWRYEASMFRGLFILEFMLEKGKFDWITQTISAAFGPIGIYTVLRGFERKWGVAPRFLGVQQAANCPLFKAWKAQEQSKDSDQPSSPPELLARVMYDINPQTYGTYQELSNILNRTRGDLITIHHTEFNKLFESNFEGTDLLELLAAQGIRITTCHGDVVEKTGLIALSGTLKAINEGLITPGSKVLCCLTSGVSDADGKAIPEYSVRDIESMLREFSA
ncbi:pyridoxal-phosphate dependent enzyme [candidate division CSSED10-310 bacterium]|uniref:Pyridoxal-phosphate dependent enzyme n=1 Tax=candidate division CSSED10-310 bacterium TaxID=2855610 RepID=A0ABV6YYN5_UNCC1